MNKRVYFHFVPSKTTAESITTGQSLSISITTAATQRRGRGLETPLPLRIRRPIRGLYLIFK